MYLSIQGMLLNKLRLTIYFDASTKGLAMKFLYLNNQLKLKLPYTNFLTL